MTGTPIRLLFSIAVLLILNCASGLSCQAAIAEDSDLGNTQPLPSKHLQVVNFITWWSHDAVGYHPAIIIKYENISGRDLSGQVIRFQGRFTDVRNGYVTVARKELHEDLPVGGQKFLLMRGPSSFELPIDENSWPLWNVR